MDFENRLRGVDWVYFSGPEFYDSKELVDAIMALYELSCPDDARDSMLRRVLCAIGNDHRGTYYPAILKALGFIQEISTMSFNKHSSHVALCVLWILGSRFQCAELGSYSENTAEEIEDFVKKHNDTTGIEDPWRPYVKPWWKLGG